MALFYMFTVNFYFMPWSMKHLSKNEVDITLVLFIMITTSTIRHQENMQSVTMYLHPFSTIYQYMLQCYSIHFTVI